jgi:short-subunit dehydrogenase
MAANTRPFAIVTGASSGIGYELATCCVDYGFDVLIAADEPAITEAAQDFRKMSHRC